jgi:hypothetical protein
MKRTTWELGVERRIVLILKGSVFSDLMQINAN